MRKYPREGEQDKLKPNTGLKCAKCGEQAKIRQWIQLSHFRGEDEYINLCKTCKYEVGDKLRD